MKHLYKLFLRFDLIPIILSDQSKVKLKLVKFHLLRAELIFDVVNSFKIEIVVRYFQKITIWYSVQTEKCIVNCEYKMQQGKEREKAERDRNNEKSAEDKSKSGVSNGDE